MKLRARKRRLKRRPTGWGWIPNPFRDGLIFTNFPKGTA